MEKINFFSSWSGGKDSTLAHYKAIEGGGAAKLLLSIFEAGGEKSRAHGLRREIIKAQSEAIGIPLVTVEASWGKYREVFVEFLKSASSQDINSGVFGDIDLEEHRNWIQDAAADTGIQPIFPLWGMKREEVVAEFIESGFEAYIVACKKDVLDKSFLGRRLDRDLLEELREKKVDLAGENGEYHTLVVDGPIFRKKLDIKMLNITEDERCNFMEIAL